MRTLFMLLLAAGTAIGGSSCLSLGTANTSPETPCEIESGLAGVWKDRRNSQLGPSAMEIRLGCDCSYRVDARFALLLGARERGAFRVEDGRLVLERANGSETIWPYRLDGDQLWLDEGDAEAHGYRRAKRFPCSDGQ